MQVFVDDMVIHYERSGSGQVVLLVHGWADSLSSFYDLRQSLSDKYDVIALDLPGFGQSSHTPKAWTLDDFAIFLANFLDKLKVSTYCVIGHSNGGAILIVGLANNVLNSEKLILIASAGIRNKNKIRKQTLKAVAKSGKVVTAVLPNRIRNNFKRRLYGRVASDMLLSPHMEETFKLVVGQDVQSKASQLKIDSLLIYGQGDKETPIEFGEILNNKISGSKLAIIDNAEHFVHNDQPNQVEKLIKDFLA